MDKEKMPIAVFDSGLGGISVLKRIYELLPGENYIYYGDSANAPYGEKSREEIMSRCDAITEDMLCRGAKAVVVACNTATSVAAAHLREKYPDVPVIGLEPALKPAVEEKREGAVVVMATHVTLSGEKFSALLDRFKESREIILMPAPRLVEFVEDGVYGGEPVEEYVRELFAPYGGRKIASVVLGCTHFPFLKESIRRVVGDVGFYDGAFGTANETVRRLAKLDLLSDGGEGRVVFENSIPGDGMIRRSQELFDRRI